MHIVIYYACILYIGVLMNLFLLCVFFQKVYFLLYIFSSSSSSKIYDYDIVFNDGPITKPLNVYY